MLKPLGELNYKTFLFVDTTAFEADHPTVRLSYTFVDVEKVKK